MLNYTDAACRTISASSEVTLPSLLMSDSGSYSRLPTAIRSAITASVTSGALPGSASRSYQNSATPPFAAYIVLIRFSRKRNHFGKSHLRHHDICISAHRSSPILAHPAPGKQPARLLALTLCERSCDLGIPVRQIRGAVLEHQVKPDIGYVITHPIDDRCGAAFDVSGKHQLPQQDL